MAGKPAGKDSKGGKDSNAKAGGPSMGQTMIAFLVGGLIAAGLGGFLGYSNAPTTPPPDAAAKKPGAHGEKATTGEGEKFEMGVIDLAPVVTNLAAPTDIWVRLEMSLIIEGKTLPHGEAMAAEITGDMLAYMRTLTLPQIQGVAGLQHLRQDLAERAATRSDGKVRGLVIKALVVQ